MVADRVSRSPMVTRTAKDIEVGLARGVGCATRKAPQFPVLVVVALEQVVVDAASAKYRRVYAWYKIVRVWAALRFDDTLHVDPARVLFRERGLELRVDQTKTTGPGKKLASLVAFVGMDAYVGSAEWLPVGFGLFQELGAGLQRSYLLPMPDGALGGFRDTPVLYQDEMHLMRVLLSELCRPVVDGAGSWSQGVESLLDPGAIGFWTVHSDRAVMPTWGACLGLSPSQLAAFGRWSATGSAEYVRSSGQLVMSAQASVSGALRSGRRGPDTVGETELLKQLCEHMAARGATPASSAEAAARLVFFSPGSSGGSGPGSSSSAAVLPEGAGPDVLVTSPVVDPEAQSPSEEGPDSASVQAEGLELTPAAESFVYLISITARATRRCLHLADGCWRARGHNFADYELLAELPEATRYTSVCRDCWRTSGTAQSLAGEAADSDGSSSTSVGDA